MTTSEEWRPVVGYEGYYEVSNLGQVRGLPRVVSRSDGGSSAIAGRVLRGFLRDGYPSVRLTRNAKSRAFFVHRLVAVAFIGPAPEGYEVCHNNGNRLNPNVDNLRWGTRLENVADTKRHGTYVNPNALKTHCKRGHSLEGCYIDPTHGQRICRLCRSMRARERNKRKRAASEAQTSGASG